MRTLVMLCLMISAAGPVVCDEGASVAYQVDGGSYEGFFIRGGEKSPLILLIHDWDGLTEYEIRRSRMLAELGYTVFAADLFGAGIRPVETAEKQKLTGELYKDRGKLRRLMHAALQCAETQKANLGNAAAVGYCFGGTAVLELARSGTDLKSFISFHGGLEVPEGQDFSKTKGRILILHGSADRAVSMEQFADLAKLLETSRVPHEMITYGGADHAFTVFGGERYNENADKKSWSYFTDHISEVLAP